MSSYRAALSAGSGVSAENGSPKAASWGLTHRRNGFLEHVLRARIQLSRDTAGIQVSVPGPQIQGEGYDEPLPLSECIADAADLPVALQVMADRVARVLVCIIVDKGVSVKTEPAPTLRLAGYGRCPQGFAHSQPALSAVEGLPAMHAW